MSASWDYLGLTWCQDAGLTHCSKYMQSVQLYASRLENFRVLDRGHDNTYACHPGDCSEKKDLVAFEILLPFDASNCYRIVPKKLDAA